MDVEPGGSSFSDGAMLQKLPVSDLGKKVGLKKTPNKFVEAFLSNTIKKNFDSSKFSKELYPFDRQKIKKRVRHTYKKRKKLTVAEKHELGITKLNHKEITFKMFKPIHILWIQYIQEVLQLGRDLPADMNGFYQKLLKADYHGCFLVVAASKCPTYVGTQGIVIQETKNVFRIVTPSDQVKTIPKLNSIFAFKINDKVFKIYGNHFRALSYERPKIKFKNKTTTDL